MGQLSIIHEFAVGRSKSFAMKKRCNAGSLFSEVSGGFATIVCNMEQCLRA